MFYFPAPVGEPPVFFPAGVQGMCWQPAPDVKRLDNSETPDRDYFVLPVPEIGRLVAAGSSLRQEEEPRGIAIRLLVSARLGLGFGLGVALVTLVLSHLFRKPFDLVIATFFFSYGGLFGVFMGWVTSSFSHECCYVGTDGVAWFGCAGSRERLVGCNVILFKHAHCLTKTEESHGGGRGGSQIHIHHEWFDEDGNLVFGISYHRNTSSLDMEYALALATEEAWSKYPERNRLIHSGR